MTCGSCWLPESHRLGLVLLSLLGNRGQCHSPSKLQSHGVWKRVVVFSSQGILKTSVVGEGDATAELHKGRRLAWLPPH